LLNVGADVRRFKFPYAKAAEGSRTPRRFARFVRFAYLRQVVECGGARPEGPLPLSLEPLDDGISMANIQY
jgi:predicted alpha/beta-hydrolase family hydrolase